MVSSWTTFVRIISAPHAIQRIARTPVRIALIEHLSIVGSIGVGPRHNAVKRYAMR
jgi:hypothetical protein